MKIDFYIRGLTQMVYCHVSFGKHDRAAGFSTNLKVDKNFKNQKFFGKNAKVYNATLEQIRADVLEAYQDLRLRHDKSRITAKDVQAYYLNPNGFEVQIDFSGLAAEFLKTQIEKVSKGTYTHLVCKLRSVEKFEQKFELSKEWLDAYYTHLQGQAFTVDHVARCIDFVQRVIRWAFEQKKVLKNPFEGYKVPRGDHRAIPASLTLEELELLEREEFVPESINDRRMRHLPFFALEHLIKARDLFVFQCYTGLAYNELKNFDYATHIIEFADRKWIRIIRGKSKELTEVPLAKKALAILEKYNFKLPVPKNDVYNFRIKEVFGWIGLGTEVTTHLARKTAGTIWLNKGFDYEEVARMLGHSSPETTRKFYARVKKERIMLKMKALDLMSSW